MFKFIKVAAMLAIMPILAVVSSPVFAGSPGQLAGGDTYVVKNITQGGAYANSVNATCNNEVQYSMQLSNTQFGALDNVTLKVTLPSAGGTSTATATTSLGGQSGTTDTATVNLTSGANQTLVNGTTVLYDGNGNAINTLPNTVATSGVNIGTIGGSTTKFVNFKAKVNCAVPTCPAGQTGTPPHCVTPVCPAGQTGTPPHCEVPMCPAGTTGTPPKCVELPKPSVVCDALKAEFIGSTNVPAMLKFTAKASAKDGATITGYVFDFGDGAKEDSTAATIQHTYTKEGDYKATVQVKSSLGLTAISSSCTVKVKVTKEKPPVVEIPPVVTTEVPPTPTPSTPAELPSTGPVEVISGLFGTSSLGFGIRQWLMSRRRLSDSF